MITSIGIYLAIIALAAYFIWFVFINKCELESSLMKTLVGDPYTIDDFADLIGAILIQLLGIPFVIFISLAFLWPVVIVGMIILFIYKRKYNL